jgi:steroid 5-alpha reductase family enzyme
MEPQKQRSPLAGISAALVLGALVSLAGSQGSVQFSSIPVFALCGALAFAVNWLAFIPANASRTEKYYDLTGSITYLTVILTALLLSGSADPRALIAAAMVSVWTLRLGIFLFRRIRREGKDGRFDEIKTDPMRFLMAWTLQGLWVLLTAAAALAIITTDSPSALGWVAFLGIAVWVTGFTIEVVADRQKSRFREDPANDGRFIDSGLWAWSRHPNYFGEITLWTGMAIMATPILSGWRWVVLISPVFVTLLLTRISGIPMLEARADKRWGHDEAYRRYKSSTPALVPRPPRR